MLRQGPSKPDCCRRAGLTVYSDLLRQHLHWASEVDRSERERTEARRFIHISIVFAPWGARTTIDIELWTQCSELCTSRSAKIDTSLRLFQEVWLLVGPQQASSQPVAGRWFGLKSPLLAGAKTTEKRLDTARNGEGANMGRHKSRTRSSLYSPWSTEAFCIQRHNAAQSTEPTRKHRAQIVHDAWLAAKTRGVERARSCISGMGLVSI